MARDGGAAPAGGRRPRRMWHTAWRWSRKAGVTAVGLVVVVVGIVLMPLPGPGTLIVLVGLAVLATEYPWARRLANRIRQRAAQAAALARERMTARRSRAGAD